MTTGADIAIAIGTIATAVAAVIGLGVSLWINGRDRAQTERVAERDRQAASDRATQDRANARDEALRRHTVDLLLEVGRAVAKHAAYSTMNQGSDAGNQIRILLSALPAECAVSVRKKFNAGRTWRMPGAVSVKQQYLDVANAVDPDVNQMSLEIAYDIEWYMTGGTPADRAWDVDLTVLQAWQREHFPR